MALKAGRVGVNPKQVDAGGNIKGSAVIPAETQGKIDRALLTPVSKPAEIKLVGVNTNNSQKMYGLGNGLQIGGDKLIAAELPEIVSGDAGKVLKVNQDETGVEWSDPPSGGIGFSQSMNDPGVFAGHYYILDDGTIGTGGESDMMWVFDLNQVPEFPVLLISMKSSGTATIKYGYSNSRTLGSGDSVTNVVKDVNSRSTGVYYTFDLDKTKGDYVYVSNFGASNWPGAMAMFSYTLA